MNDKLYKPEIIRRTSDKLVDRINIEIVENILSALIEVVTEAIADGDSIGTKQFGMMEPKLCKERMVRNVHDNTGMILPAQYRARFKPGVLLKAACEQLNERELGEKGVGTLDC